MECCVVFFLFMQDAWAQNIGSPERLLHYPLLFKSFRHAFTSSCYSVDVYVLQLLEFYLHIHHLSFKKSNQLLLILDETV